MPLILVRRTSRMNPDALLFADLCGQFYRMPGLVWGIRAICLGICNHCRHTILQQTAFCYETWVVWLEMSKIFLESEFRFQISTPCAHPNHSSIAWLSQLFNNILHIVSVKRNGKGITTVPCPALAIFCSLHDISFSFYRGEIDTWSCLSSGDRNAVPAWIPYAPL
jgi:hypothetical protein